MTARILQFPTPKSALPTGAFRLDENCRGCGVVRYAVPVVGAVRKAAQAGRMS